MPGYITKVLTRFAPTLLQGADSPALYIPPTYGAKAQKPCSDTTVLLDAPQRTRIQGIIGSLLFYARGVDPTILPAVNMIASLQANPTQSVSEATDRLLQYCARYPDNSVTLHACDMVLHVQSDASYLSRPNARSVAGGIFYMGQSNKPELINGSILALSTLHPSSPPWSPLLRKQNMPHFFSSAKRQQTCEIFWPILAIRSSPRSSSVTTRALLGSPTTLSNREDLSQ